MTPTAEVTGTGGDSVDFRGEPAEAQRDGGSHERRSRIVLVLGTD